MQIALCIYFSTSSAAVAKPCLIESPTFIPWNEWSKVIDCQLKVREFTPQKNLYIIRPNCDDRVNTFEFTCKFSPKVIASNGAPVFNVVPVNKVSTNNHDNYGYVDTWIKKHGYGVFQYVYPVIIVLIMFALGSDKSEARMKI